MARGYPDDGIQSGTPGAGQADNAELSARMLGWGMADQVGNTLYLEDWSRGVGGWLQTNINNASGLGAYLASGGPIRVGSVTVPDFLGSVSTRALILNATGGPGTSTCTMTRKLPQTSASTTGIGLEVGWRCNPIGSSAYEITLAIAGISMGLRLAIGTSAQYQVLTPSGWQTQTVTPPTAGDAVKAVAGTGRTYSIRQFQTRYAISALPASAPSSVAAPLMTLSAQGGLAINAYMAVEYIRITRDEP